MERKAVPGTQSRTLREGSLMPNCYAIWAG